ncbi:uncharacterized protein CDAR_522601 [Caerostris darwini]|uniref:Chitin-binding type-2 domain-containing protein n=1 Tax=Caerostris darwini TaxID=1538125 RepID=A0AAV4X4L7_9ARAC|nr:uncharacterized protein CDAR_522601 [Caerostris darwini]
MKLQTAVLLLSAFLKIVSSDDNIVGEPCQDKYGIIPNPDDCSNFFVCKNGIYDFVHCTDGLLFNKLKSTCDYKASVDCDAEVPPNSTALNRTVVPEDEQTCDTDTCTCVYPADYCSEYYWCENGVAYKEKCPEGLLLNQEKLTCDYAENVECDENTSITMKVTTQSNNSSKINTYDSTATSSKSTGSSIKFESTKSTENRFGNITSETYNTKTSNSTEISDAYSTNTDSGHEKTTSISQEYPSTTESTTLSKESNHLPKLSRKMSRSIIDSTIVTPTSSTEKLQNSDAISQTVHSSSSRVPATTILQKIHPFKPYIEIYKLEPNSSGKSDTTTPQKIHVPVSHSDIYNLVPSISRDRMTYLPKKFGPFIPFSYVCKLVPNTCRESVATTPKNIHVPISYPVDRLVPNTSGEPVKVVRSRTSETPITIISQRINSFQPFSHFYFRVPSASGKSVTTAPQKIHSFQPFKALKTVRHSSTSGTPITII